MSRITTPRIKITIPIVANVGAPQSIAISGTVTRAVFDGPDLATYDWLVKDLTGAPVTGRAGQVGDRVIVEEWPVQDGFTIELPTSDTNGSMDIILWLKA